MAENNSKYTFLPWLRQGIANQINSPEDGSIRASIDVKFRLVTNLIDSEEKKIDEITNKVEVLGPGDIIGIDKRLIVKSEPRDWNTNFEPNYLPYIEFYDEDFPWRYSPEKPWLQNSRLTPWIMLIVLKEEEFKDVKNIKDKPLPAINIVGDSDEVLPGTDELWAWAHVHVNRDLDKSKLVRSKNDEIIIDELEALLDEDPDLAYSRIICPRKLEPKSAYHAFLVPVFETGRLSGLGLKPEEAPNATTISWSNYNSKQYSGFFPYYHRWYFRTGTLGDFEYLVRLLKPRPVDSRVGNRDIDVQHPGSNIAGINDPELNGVLRLGGALRAPLSTLKGKEETEAEKYENWDSNFPHPFQRELAAFINLADDYRTKNANAANSDIDSDSTLYEFIHNDPDPLITPPLYGQWHSLTNRLSVETGPKPVHPLTSIANILVSSVSVFINSIFGSSTGEKESTKDIDWRHELNLDPRHRTAAGIGTNVIKKNQEEYMDAAWSQVGDIQEANDRIRKAQLAKEVSSIWYSKHLKPISATSPEQFAVLTNPISKRIIHNGFTAYYQLNTSKSSVSPFTLTTRKILKPRGKIVKALNFNSEVRVNNFIDRIQKEQVSAAPKKSIPEQLLTIKKIANNVIPSNIPDAYIDLHRKYPWIKFVPLGIAVVLVLLIFVFPVLSAAIGVPLAVGSMAAFGTMQYWSSKINKVDFILEDKGTPEKIEKLSKSPDFKISETTSLFKPSIGNQNSREAINFDEALKNSYLIILASKEVGKEPILNRIDLNSLSNSIISRVNPEDTIPKFTFNTINIPERFNDFKFELFIEAMAYPEFNDPMYKRLLDLSEEFFLPNLNLIPQNSITLLETNQKFIESYMVGLNHEFARELLWREYPTDQRGSYFRQFWDVSTLIGNTNRNNEELKEELRDIPPLHRWSKFSKLGEHDNREKGGKQQDDIVLVIRGELLKKFPNTIIYAHRAEWQYDANGEIDIKKNRNLYEIDNEDTFVLLNNPIIKSPLYTAKVEPDIYFLGFDLTACEVKGGTGKKDVPVDNDCKDEGINWDDPGWFFVFKEIPGEPRFGLDIGNEQNIQFWNDLSWGVVMAQSTSSNFITIDDSINLSGLSDDEGDEEDESEKGPQRDEDIEVKWRREMNSAELAYILFQSPVLVAVHGSEMLP